MQNAQAIFLQTIEALIQENELEKALQAMLELEKQTNAGLKKDLVSESGRLKEIEQLFNRGRLTPDNYILQKNAVRDSLTFLVQDFPKQIQLNAQIQGLTSYNFTVPDEERLEKIIGNKNNLLKINWLEKALQASKAVCRVVCADGELGTGFLTRDGYIFTNHHVISDAKIAADTRVEFNYEMDVNGQVKSRSSYRLDATDFVTSPPNELDFSRVKIIDNPAEPLKKWGFVEFDTSAIPTVGESVTIIQHPKGQDKQIALHANEVISLWNQHIFYETDTEPGSSGSPVFNNDWKVVAIHHAGGNVQINARGDRREANRGILMSQIFDFIAKKQGKPMPQVTSNDPKKLESHNEMPLPTTPSASPPVQPVPPQRPASIPKWLVLYAVEDEDVAKILNKHLAVLKFTKKITLFNVHTDVKIGATEDQIDAEIESADLIITLVTPQLFGSEFWFGKLLEAIEAKKMVVPVLVERVDFAGTGLEKLKSLPPREKFISDYPNRDTAWAEVVAELKKAV